MEPEGSLLHSQVPIYSNVRLSCIVNLADFFFFCKVCCRYFSLYCITVFKFQFNYDIYGSLDLTRNPNYVAAVCTYRRWANARELQARMHIPLSRNVCTWYRTKGKKNESSNTDKFMYLLQTRPSQLVDLLRYLTVWPWENSQRTACSWWVRSVRNVGEDVTNVSDVLSV
jgi:hypothetical protein